VSSSERPPGDGQRDRARYSLRCSVEVFPAPDGDVYLMRPGGGDDLVVQSASSEDVELLQALSAGPLELERDSWEAGRLAPLVDADIVLARATPATALPPQDAARFSRQLAYLGELAGVAPEQAQRRLREARVVMIGAGGSGTWTLSALACLGIGELVLVDDDVVELSNLNRQVLFRFEDVGRPKAEAAASWVRGLDPSIDVVPVIERVRGTADLAGVLPGADVLIVAADWPPYALERWANAACIEAGVPFLTAGQRLPIVRIGPTYVPGVGPCLECQERDLRARFPLYDDLARHRQERSIEGEPALGPPFGVVGSLLAIEVMHLILGVRPLATEGRALIMDLRTLETRWEATERDPQCPACGESAN
jgi:bacteriocin biosynthesis cyclodehydratase domain-containing protein